MAKNYGIGFCKEGIRRLLSHEDRLLAETGFGFDQFSKEYQQLLKYQRMLKDFQAEKNAGLPPSYDPNRHGSIHD